MTTKEAFARLISKRGWYHDVGLTAPAGQSLAKRFKDGESISLDKVEEILKKAGYTVICEKLWFHPDLPKPPADNHPRFDLSDAYFEAFRKWDELHTHMIPRDMNYITRIGLYDVYLNKLERQNAGK